MTYQRSRINLHNTTILFEGYNIHSIVTSLNYKLGKLIIWLNANKLSINVSQTNYTLFHCARRKIDRKDIISNNYILQQVHKIITNSIGITIDDKLKWANHIFYIKNRIAKGMGILLKARKVLKRFYYSYIIPLYFHIDILHYTTYKIIIIISFSR